MNSKEENNQKQWSELKQLLMEEETNRLRTLEGKILHPEEFAKAIGEVLVESIQKTPDKNRLSQKLYPIVEESIYKSVQKDPESLADAIYPVITPAIRKAINEALKKLTESVNQSVSEGLSVKSIKWRLQALFTNQTYGDLVLKYSLLYQVQELYLIHTETGLLINHLSQKTGDNPDGDMISGMLTAIRDFVSDSFKVDKSDTLETIEVGDLFVLVEQGPHASLACVVKGEPTTKLRRDLQSALESIHQDFGPELAKFKGDTAELEDTSQALETCLVTELEKKEESGSGKLKNVLVFIGLILLGLIVYSVYWGYQYRNMKKEISQAGYTVLMGKHTWRKFDIVITNQVEHILLTEKQRKRDEKKGSESKEVSLKQISQRNPEEILIHFSEIGAKIKYLDLSNSSISKPPLERIRNYLGQDTIQVSTYSDSLGTVYLSGQVSAERKRQIQSYIPILTEGAPIDYNNLIANEYLTFLEFKSELESMLLLFQPGSVKLEDGQIETVIQLNYILSKVNQLCRELNESWQLEVSGSTDPTGSIESNAVLANDRALFTVDQLIDKDLDCIFVNWVGSNERKKERIKSLITDKDLWRNVNFELKKVSK